VTIICDTDLMVTGVCAPIAREGRVMPQFLAGGGDNGMSAVHVCDTSLAGRTTTNLVQMNTPLPFAPLWGVLSGRLPLRPFALAPVRQSRIVHRRSAL
jgi:hypothetical protein